MVFPWWSSNCLGRPTARRPSPRGDIPCLAGEAYFQGLSGGSENPNMYSCMISNDYIMRVTASGDEQSSIDDRQ